MGWRGILLRRGCFRILTAKQTVRWRRKVGGGLGMAASWLAERSELIVGLRKV